MRATTRLAACLLVGLGTGGCGDATSPETVAIASIPLRFSGGAATVTSTVQLFAGYLTGSSITLVLDTVPVTSQSVGSQVVLTSDSAAFAAAAALLTNGVDDWLQRGIRVEGGSGTQGAPESGAYENRVTGSTPPELHGFVIERVILELDSVALATPGTNPNGNGNWTDYRVVGRLVFEGHH